MSWRKIERDTIKTIVEQEYAPRCEEEHGIQLSCERGPRNMSLFGRNQRGETAAFPVRRRRSLPGQAEEIELAYEIVVRNLLAEDAG
ncbi:MAG: hypothetical protein WBQ41_03565 [Solirubrobacterales bacterium]